jgi:hypothetical protein
MDSSLMSLRKSLLVALATIQSIGRSWRGWDLMDKRPAINWPMQLGYTLEEHLPECSST